MPTQFKFSITNYSECVMNDVIFQDWMSDIQCLKSCHLNFCVWFLLVEYLILRKWWFTSFEPIGKLLIKFEKILNLWRHFERLLVTHFWTKKFISIPIEPSPVYQWIIWYNLYHINFLIFQPNVPKKLLKLKLNLLFVLWHKICVPNSCLSFLKIGIQNP